MQYFVVHYDASILLCLLLTYIFSQLQSLQKQFQFTKSTSLCDPSLKVIGSNIVGRFLHYFPCPFPSFILAPPRLTLHYTFYLSAVSGHNHPCAMPPTGWEPDLLESCFSSKELKSLSHINPGRNNQKFLLLGLLYYSDEPSQFRINSNCPG